MPLQNKYDNIFSLAYHYSMCDPSDQSTLELAFDAACQCVERCQDFGDFGMTLTYLDLADSKCSRRRDYCRLRDLLKAFVRSYSSPNSARPPPSNLHRVELALIRVESRFSHFHSFHLPSAITTSVHHWVKSMRNYFRSSKVNPLDQTF